MNFKDVTKDSVLEHLYFQENTMEDNLVKYISTDQAFSIAMAIEYLRSAIDYITNVQSDFLNALLGYKEWVRSVYDKYNETQDENPLEQAYLSLVWSIDGVLAEYGYDFFD